MSTNPPAASDATDLVQAVRQVIKDMIGKGGLPRVMFGQLATYVSGNPKIILPMESAAPSDARTQKVFQPYGVFSNKPVTGDTVIILEDEDGNRDVIGKVVDQASIILDANALCGVYPVEPGTTTTHASANTEQNTTSASYVKLKEFYVTRPGKYRLTFGLARTGGTTQAIVRRRQDELATTYQDVTGAASSAGTYPTFNSNTLDMTIAANWGDFISVWVLNTLGPSQTGYINNCVLKSQPATAALAVNDLVILD